MSHFTGETFLFLIWSLEEGQPDIGLVKHEMHFPLDKPHTDKGIDAAFFLLNNMGQRYHK